MPELSVCTCGPVGVYPMQTMSVVGGVPVLKSLEVPSRGGVPTLLPFSGASGPQHGD